MEGTFVTAFSLLNIISILSCCAVVIVYSREKSQPFIFKMTLILGISDLCVHLLFGIWVLFDSDQLSLIFTHLIPTTTYFSIWWASFIAFFLYKTFSTDADEPAELYYSKQSSLKFILINLCLSIA